MVLTIIGRGLAVSMPSHVARAVRALAQREGIPLVANPVLARWLYRAGEAGRPIPAETFVAVAQTVAALIGAGVLDA